jgi:hypothetical protein
VVEAGEGSWCMCRRYRSLKLISNVLHMNVLCEA